MTLLSTLSIARGQANTIFHDFLLYYDKSPNIIYVFIEGIQDPSFYSSILYHYFQEYYPKHSMHLRPCKGKEKIIELYKLFNWRRYPKHRLLFFIDKDLSDFLGHHPPTGSNLYETEYYSIENYLVSIHMMRRILGEILHIPTHKYDLKNVLKLFQHQLNEFHYQMIGIMALILACRRDGQKTFLDDIRIKDLFTFNLNGQIRRKHIATGGMSAHGYIHHKAKILPLTQSFAKIRTEIRSFAAHNPKEYIRGKYELEFLVRYFNLIRDNPTLISPSLLRAPKIHTEIGIQNAVEILGPRVNCPKSLRAFLRRNMRFERFKIFLSKLLN